MRKYRKRRARAARIAVRDRSSPRADQPNQRAFATRAKHLARVSAETFGADSERVHGLAWFVKSTGAVRVRLSRDHRGATVLRGFDRRGLGFSLPLEGAHTEWQHALIELREAGLRTAAKQILSEVSASLSSPPSERLDEGLRRFIRASAQ
jgi:hypothetical protein